MNSPHRKLALLLAGSGLSIREIEKAVFDLQPIELLMEVEYLRKEGSRVPSRLHYEPKWVYRHEEEGLTRASPRRISVSDIGERVEILLKTEAGLGTSEARDLLAQSLAEAGAIHHSELPPLSRKALSSWVVRLSKLVPAKLILSHATKIRNSFVNSPNADWHFGPKVN